MYIFAYLCCITNKQIDEEEEWWETFLQRARDVITFNDIIIVKIKETLEKCTYAYVYVVLHSSMHLHSTL